MKKLLEDIRDNNILLEVVDGNLKVFAEQGNVDAGLISEIRQRKDELIHYLANTRPGNPGEGPQDVILPAPDRKDYPLSAAQRRLWLASRSELGSAAYNMPQAYLLEGRMDPQLLQDCFHRLMDRHESLRTVFRPDDKGDIRQQVLTLEKMDWHITQRDLQNKPDQDAMLVRALREDYNKPFDLHHGPLLRAGLIRLSENKWALYCVMPHIICDGWSMGILVNELLSLYDAGMNGKALDLPPLQIQYKDFAVWQETQISLDRYKAQRAYWRQQLDGELPVMELPVDKQRPSVRTHNGGILHRTIEKRSWEQFTALVAGHGSTPFTGLLAIVNILLYRYSSQKDIIIGSPVAGRNRPELESQIGLYLNTLPLRTRLQGEDGFLKILELVRQTMREAHSHQDYPFDQILNDIQLPRDTSRHPLFDVFIDFHDNSSLSKIRYMGEAAVKPYDMVGQTVSKFDLTFMFTDAGDGLTLGLEYNSDLYAKETIERLHTHFSGLMDAVLLAPRLPISRLPYLDREQQRRLQIDFNLTTANYDGYRPVISLFADQVRRSPDATAVICGEDRLTYAQLDGRSEQLAAALRRHLAPAPVGLTGILMRRSIDMVVAIWGILKAGGAYVPIDLEYPEERKRYMVEDTGIKVLLAQADMLLELSWYDGTILAVDLLQQEEEPAPMPASTSPDALAYVLYTSGSTGRPKGCAITQGNLSAYVQWANNYYFHTAEESHFGLFTSLSFDLTVTSLFCSLTRGAVLTIYDHHADLPQVLRDMFEGQGKVCSVKLTPSHVRLLKAMELRSEKIHCVILGGEEVTPELVGILRGINGSMRIYNEYGPTETTVGCMVQELEEGEEVLIGKPIFGTQIYILDEGNSLCPIGVPGEICIGGMGVGLGYWKKEEQTALRFVQHSFGEGRLYRTGDRGKWLPNGRVKYMGRLDDQVKIRGYRIEPGEIEEALLGVEGIHEAAIVAAPDRSGSRKLVAYVVTSDAWDQENIQSLLARRLPGYMVPETYIRVSALPLTAHGKTDRRKLAELPLAGQEPAYRPPLSDLEIRLSEEWRTLLGRSRIGLDDNFFSLGGDSIRAITFVVKVNKLLGLELPLDKLYELRTLEKVAAFLSALQESGTDDLTGTKKLIADYHQSGLQKIHAIRQQMEEKDRELHQLPEQYEDIYPMVPIEQGMIYSSLLNPEEPVYYDQFSYRIYIEDKDRFIAAIHKLVQRHPILRTVYYMSRFNTPLKIVLQEITVPLVYEDLSGLSKEEKITRINDYIREDLDRRLSFDGDLLWRVNLFRLDTDEYHITYSFHHALLDGWSVSVFKTALANYTGEELPPLAHSYKDYCAVQLGRDRSADVEAYWKGKLKGYTRNKLPFNYKGLRICGETGMRRVTHMLPDALLADVRQVALDHGLSIKSVCVAAHVCLMHIICSEQDVVTGVVTHDRPELEDGEKIMGCFLNTVAIRMNVGELTDLLSLLKQADDYLAGMRPYEVHLSEISRIIGDTTSSSNPIFDTILNFTDFHTYENLSLKGSFADPEISNMEVANEMTNTLFDVEVDKTLDKFTIKIKYAPAYFREEEVDYAASLYERILEQIVRDVRQPIGSLDLLTTPERTEVLVAFNATEAPYGSNKTLHGLLEAQAAVFAGGIALRQDGRELTYGALNEQANRLARHLIDQGVRPGHSVGLLASRSFGMIVGLYGILKAGGAYVPIDPDYPVERQEYILSNSGVTTLVTDDEYPLIQQAAASSDSALRVVHTGKGLSPADRYKELTGGNPGLHIDSRQLAYTIYTSGSTGRPKGVMIEHHSAVNLIEWVNETFNVGHDDRLLFITSICFDLSVYDIFGVLAAGGTVVIGRREEVQDVMRLKKMLTEERITFWDSVPTTMNFLVGEMEEEATEHRQTDLRLVFLSGDWIPVQLPDRIRKYFPQAQVISLGGATEGTVWSNYYPIGQVGPRWSSIPYGRPIRNNYFYILDDRLRPVPKGVTGELYIGGVGVARGYANDGEKTAASFKADPFNTRLGGRMYKTGDLGRMLPEGNMEFLGRKDFQVKINGFRVELGEIESILLKYPGIKDAIVSVYKNAANNQLCAYLVTEEEPDREAVNTYLRAILPSYMIPALYVRMDAIPLNSNGKIDRSALPSPPAREDVNASANIAPTTDVQRKLASIWAVILRRDDIGIRDNFFELGANSLSVGTLVNRVHRELGQLLPIREVFLHPTIEALARLLDHRGSDLFAVVRPAPAMEYYPLSASQRQLWLLDQFGEGQQSYHIPGVYVFEGRLDVQALEYAFQQLIDRHEILRTVFTTDSQGETGQFICLPSAMGGKLRYRDLRTSDGKEELARQFIQEELATPFDLAAGPLLRACLLQLLDDKWVFSYTLHHIVSDGWSTGIIIRELLLFYKHYTSGTGIRPAPLPIQYKDYSFWQQQLLQGADALAHRNYWLQQFAGELPVLELPGDRARPAVKTYNGNTIRRTIPPAILTGLQAIALQQGATLFMTLIAVIDTLLYRYSGQTDIVIGSPVAGRDHVDLEDQIGFYVNTLALRTKFSGDDSFLELLQHVKKMTLEAFAHQSYPFDELIRDLDIRRDVSRSNLFDVMVILQNHRADDSAALGEIHELKITPYEDIIHASSKFDLTFDFVETGDGLQTSIEYNTDIFDESSIQRLAGHLIQLSSALIDEPRQPVGMLDYLPDPEKLQVLTEFNDTARPYPGAATLVSLFEQQAARTPELTALVFENKTYSYRWLNEMANRLCAYLKETYAVKSDDRIGLILDRNEWMVISMLGVLKAGGACVPVDNEYPPARIEYITDDCKCTAIIDEDELQRFLSQAQHYDTTDMAPAGSSHDLAYIIYTSGSTGGAKGCMLEHKGVVNHLFSKLDLLQLQEGCMICHNSELHFVGGIWQLWAPLTVGGTVTLCNKKEMKDIGRLFELSRSSGAKVLELIPSQLNEYLVHEEHLYLPWLRTLILTGEKLSPYFVNKCYAGNAHLEIINTYGQTESSDVTVSYRIPNPYASSNVLVGTPVRNTRIYVLSPYRRLNPVGVTGEIYTSGDGVCRGYINKQALTEERFVPNPFENGNIMYRTGDLARWLPDGTLEVLGRTDDQVKVRGYRIETGYVENMLLGYDGVEEAAVLLESNARRSGPESAGEKCLVAYIVCKNALNVAGVRGFLQQKIPDYMLPSYFVQMDKIPLLENGKIDRKALVTHPGVKLDARGEYVAPSSDMEIGLTEIWHKVLQKEKIGVDDSFFDLGGHSLKATSLVNKIKKEYGVNITLMDIFQHPTVRKLAQEIQKKLWADESWLHAAAVSETREIIRL
ncbi:amino acid adenylation domain-containing protein [Flavitalea sp. BT771]|uniref:non-ribosomal peptide synthetase n=1 Tax=Flavitalea sp. BT771 TaxID=3063329 RepID=UPI0026E30582|nr:non-ribosomal peptide synthetase [Flavitalea sp. BT771]MDO6434620.1 amino acid adenylation domain-containing protein [Flavitalea sp. BT771]MDV6223520.1 amino acid adenylation domain-containing protein [Flavitalea sp. BT771]